MPEMTGSVMGWLTCPDCEQTVFVTDEDKTPCGCPGTTWQLDKALKFEPVVREDKDV